MRLRASEEGGGKECDAAAAAAGVFAQQTQIFPRSEGERERESESVNCRVMNEEVEQEDTDGAAWQRSHSHVAFGIMDGRGRGPPTI